MTDAYPTRPPSVPEEPVVEDGPLVSVVVTTYFRNDRLRAAIESALAQRYDPVEVLVVDDSGERHAEPVVAAYPGVRYVGLAENRGANTARTVGLDESAGRYVQFLDDDDRLRADKIDRQVALLEESPGVGVAYCGMRYEDGGKRRPDPAVRGDVLDRALAFEMMPCVTSTMLAAREHLEDAAPFVDRPGADDFCRMIELARRTRFDFVDDPLVVRGVIPDSRGKSMDVVDGRLEIVRDYGALYEQFPPSVRRRALSHTYALEGTRLLEDRIWSPAALRSFVRAWYYAPTPRATARVGVALFGLPGLRLGARALDVLSAE